MTSYFWAIDISGNDFIDLCVLDVILILDLVCLSTASTKVHLGVDLFSFFGDLAGFLDTFWIWSLIRYTLFFGIGNGLGANHIWRLYTNP